ncbi:MAG: iron-containing alcohol dehydrogenase [Bdellovibrionaceae bacterium]|nr:iron-containing alcohol dehydrogenase [Pseudobdellovibrionaceae bacterium]
MKNFTYFNPTKIFFGRGQIENIKKEIPPSSNVLFVYGGGSIKKNGLYDQVVSELKGFNFYEFSGIEPNPTYEYTMKAVELIRIKNIDFLLAVGGGSVIDATKFMSVAAGYKGEDPWDIIIKKLPVEKTIPLGTILTLPATGSEMNSASVITRSSTNDKLGFVRAQMYPQFSILDPTFTMSLPSKYIANGVADAFTHVMEQYLTYPVNSPIQDRFAEGILLTLIEEGPKALSNSQDYDVRANIMWSTTTALNGWIGLGVPQDWSTHMIGHELTALFDLDHAESLAVILPSVMNWNRKLKSEKLIQFGRRVWGIKENSNDLVIDTAIQKTQEFFSSLGLKTRLKEYGITNEDLAQVVEKLKEHGMIALGEHRNIDLEASQKILQYAL